ncbi:MAG TPA: transposase [Gammaproteobacteria bacterium]|nr:transposase [Gammaproteobacteria bacterium]
MARPLRIEYPGAVYHISTRGNADQTVFLDDQDRRMFLETYAEVSSRMQWRCHAYCLLNDHYHLVLETPKPNLSKGMRQLNGVYTQRFNQQHDRGGHLFQGRYKAVLVERSRYLKEVCRHVVRNPVHLRLVRKPSAWKWSSYRATAGLEEGPDWLDTEWLLSQFGRQRKRAQQAYEKFVQQEEDEYLWDDLRHQIYLGSDGFIKRMQSKPKTTTRRKGRQTKKGQADKNQKLTQLKRRSHDPKRTMATAYLSGHYTLSEIAHQFGVHYSTVSRAVKDYENSG